MIWVRKARLRDVWKVVQSLRDADRLEAERQGQVPGYVLGLSFLQSEETFAIMLDTTVVGVFGHGPDPLNPGKGIVWMVGTDLLTFNRMEFLRVSAQFIDSIFRKYDEVWNLVDSENTVHINWLKWIGCTFDPEPVIINNHSFLRFSYVYVRGSNPSSPVDRQSDRGSGGAGLSGTVPGPVPKRPVLRCRC